MPLTPADVHNVAFSKPPIGKRGYNEDEVDAFLDLVEQELSRLIEENADLRQRVAELDKELADAKKAPRSASAAALPPPRRSRLARSSSSRLPRRHRLPPLRPRPLPPRAPTLTCRPPRFWVVAQEMADRLTSDAKTKSGAAASDNARTNSEQTGQRRHGPVPRR